MIASCLIPLTVCLIAGWVTAETDNRTLDGIPAPIAAIIGVCSLIWFVAVCPWPVELALVLAVLVLGKAYLQDILKVGVNFQQACAIENCARAIDRRVLLLF